jgi:hypothetical protein
VAGCGEAAPEFMDLHCIQLRRGEVLGSTGNPACAASCYVLGVAMRGNGGGVGLTSVGAVPGERTWRDRASGRDVQIRKQRQNICSGRGAWLA